MARREPSAKPQDAGRSRPEQGLPAPPSLARLFLEPGVFVLLGLFLVFWLLFSWLGTFSATEMRIRGVDAVGYYSWVRSIAFDGDVQFQNEYRTLNAPEVLGAGDTDDPLDAFRAGDSPVNPDGLRTPTGHLQNVFSVGVGLMWSPFILVGHGVACATGAETDGFSPPYHAAVFFANMFYGLAGAVLSYVLVRTWFGKGVSAVAAVAAWTCSSALYYTFGQEAMGHAASFFIMALFLLLWVRLRVRGGTRPWVVVGLALGLTILVRWQNLTFALIPAVDLLWTRQRRDIARLAACAGACAVMVAPQIAAWKILYGSYIVIPQGAGFMAWLRPDLAGLLFSADHGLVTWTPLMAAGLAGLFLFARRHRRVGVAVLAAVLAQVYVCACAGDIGWSFGMRRLVNATPLFALGIASVFAVSAKRLRRPIALTILFAVWNVLFVLQYGGLLDEAYVSLALEDLASEKGISAQDLARSRTFPDGKPFDINAFAQQHRFPRRGSPTCQQFIGDKLAVAMVVLSKLVGG